MDAVSGLLDHLFRRESARLIAALTRALGARHLALAEEAVQDALVTALQQWPYRGVPDDPPAWLYRVARNRALDRLRHQRIVEDKAPVVARDRAGAAAAPDALLARELAPIADDQLAMMFLTCHPALSQESRVALTLKIVGGFSVGEIARAFVAAESAVAQRLVRAKRTLRERDVPFGTPSPREMVERLDSVLEAIYLTFNEGYAATTGDALVRADIAHEAIRLASLVARHPATGTPKAHALRALLLLQASRFPARLGDDGVLRQLRDQDRARWDRALIAEGLRALEAAAAGAELTPYHLEAEIAACHAGAASWEATDWPRILDCYDRLSAATGSPVVALNRAIARARVDGPRAAIGDVEALAHDPQLAGYHLVPATLAELWREAGDSARAAEHYRAALALAVSAPERRFLAARLEQL